MRKKADYLKYGSSEDVAPAYLVTSQILCSVEDHV